MYSLDEKEEIIEKIKEGIDLQKIIRTTGIPEETIYEWKEEVNLRRVIKELIADGKLEKAKKLVPRIAGDINEDIRYSILINIARRQDDLETEKELVYKQLDKYPYNIIAVTSAIKTAQREGDKQLEIILIQRLIELEPDNVMTLTYGIKLAMDQKDHERAKKLIDKKLELSPKDEKTMMNRIKIARREVDIETEKIFLNKLLEINPFNTKIIKRIRQIAIEEKDADKINEMDRKLLENEKIEPRRSTLNIENSLLNQGKNDDEQIKMARSLIYETDDILKGVEKINEILKDKRELERKIVLAELYFNLNFPKQAEEQLKKYKMELEQNSENELDIKLIKQVIELVKNLKTKRFNWDELWNKIKLLEEKTNEIENKYFTLDEKEKIVEMIKEGIDLEKITQATGTPKVILQKWKKEVENRSIESKSKEADDNRDIEISFLSKNKKMEGTVNPVTQARRLIYGTDNCLELIEEIKMLMKEQEVISQELIMSELYYNANLPKFAEDLLKKYKNQLEKNPENVNEIKLVKQAMELVKNQKTMHFNWNEIWKRKEILEKQENEERDL